jgi:hypothetical protein
LHHSILTFIRSSILRITGNSARLHCITSGDGITVARWHAVRLIPGATPPTFEPLPCSGRCAAPEATIITATPTDREPHGRKGLWSVTAALALLRVGSTLPTPLYVIYRDTFHFSTLILTLIFAAFVAGSLAALFLFGRLSDRIGRRRVMLAAVALAAVSALLFLFAFDEFVLGAADGVTGPQHLRCRPAAA